MSESINVKKDESNEKPICKSINENEGNVNRDYIGHPICRLKYFIELRNQYPEASIDELMEKAEKKCVEEGKLHGIARLAKMAEEMGYKFIRRSKKSK
jgi:DNA-binding transcriptional regulator WhiA